MAPEVIDSQSQRGYGAPADIWSFGCTVIEMAEGKPPFSDMFSPLAAMFVVGREKSHPPIPVELGEDCREFILATFRVNPALRLSAAELLKHQFLSIAAYKKRHRLSLTRPEDGTPRSQSVPLGVDPPAANGTVMSWNIETFATVM